MKRTQAAIALLLIQLALLLSIGAKYRYERHTRPRVWVRTGSYDPNQPLRGRYLALQLVVDACALPHRSDAFTPGWKQAGVEQYPGNWSWTVRLEARDGKLIAIEDTKPRSPSDAAHVSVREHAPCDRATVTPGVEYFIPDTARGPFPLPRGQELWVEVTVPESGPPRPIQLALSDSTGFHPMPLR